MVCDGIVTFAGRRSVAVFLGLTWKALELPDFSNFIHASFQCDNPVTQNPFTGDGSVRYQRHSSVTFRTDPFHQPPQMQPTATTLGLLAAMSLPALGGPAGAPAPVEANPGDWCSWLQSKPGALYKNAENPWLQSFQIGGRFQWQAAYVDGSDINGNDFSEADDDYRRVRIESKTEFLRFFSAKVGINVVNDDRRNGNDLDWGYDTFDEAVFSFDIKKAFGAGPLEELKLNYGRFKFNMTEEVHMSSKEIYTVERSAIANKLYGANSRPTGMTLDAAAGAWTATVGVFSGEDDSDFIGGWNDGQAYYLSLGHQCSEAWRVGLDFVQNDVSGSDDFLGYDWAAAFNVVYENNRFGMLTTLIAGENNDDAANRGGSFHAAVLMPWYWLVEERLQAVFQYQYAGSSESAGIRMNSRYVRAANDAAINSGRGDELHTLYLGLNYHVCGDNAKFMGGVEYTSMDAPGGDVEAVTYLLAFRTYF
jgi:hypothetical protein